MNSCFGPRLQSSVRQQSAVSTVATPQLTLENELNIDCIPHWRPIRTHARTEPQREQHVAELSVVSTIRRRIEAEKLRSALFVDVEIRDKVIASQRRRCRKRRKEKLSRSRRIVGTRSAASARSGTSSGSRPNSRSNSSAGTRTGAAGSRATGSSACALHCRSGRRRRRRDRLDDGLCYWWRRDLRLRDRRWRWRNRSRRIGCGRAKLDVLETLASRALTATRASATATRWSRAATADCGIRLEVVSGRWVEDQYKDKRMSKKRGSGALPPPLSLARYSDRRPIPSFYVDG